MKISFIFDMAEKDRIFRESKDETFISIISYQRKKVNIRLKKKQRDSITFFGTEW